MFDLDIVSIVLDDIVAYISDLPDDIGASFVVDNHSIMTYELDTFSSSKSYLVKMSLADVIRITCSDKSIRSDKTCEYSKLIKAIRDAGKQLTAFIVIVQPSLSRSVAMPERIQEVLAAASTYIKRAGKVQGLEIIGSK